MLSRSHPSHSYPNFDLLVQLDLLSLMLILLVLMENEGFMNNSEVNHVLICHRFNLLTPLVPGVNLIYIH